MIRLLNHSVWAQKSVFFLYHQDQISKNNHFFKFIVPNKNDNVARVSALYSSDTQVQMKPSSSGFLS